VFVIGLGTTIVTAGLPSPCGSIPAGHRPAVGGGCLQSGVHHMILAARSRSDTLTDIGEEIHAAHLLAAAIVQIT
jgi:hypothetical protein